MRTMLPDLSARAYFHGSGLVIALGFDCIGGFSSRTRLTGAECASESEGHKEPS